MGQTFRVPLPAWLRSISISGYLFSKEISAGKEQREAVFPEFPMKEAAQHFISVIKTDQFKIFWAANVIFLISAHCNIAVFITFHPFWSYYDKELSKDLHKQGQGQVFLQTTGL